MGSTRVKTVSVVEGRNVIILHVLNLLGKIMKNMREIEFIHKHF